MQNTTDGSPLPTEPTRPGVVQLLLKFITGWVDAIAFRLRTGNQAATLDRLLSSRHVKDLQLIVVVAFTALVLVFLFGLPLVVGNELLSSAPSTVQLEVANKVAIEVPSSLPIVVEYKPISPASSSVWAAIFNRAMYVLRAVFAGTGKFFAFFVPVLGVVGAVIAWAYQSGSARLGVIDLFACEISSLCRVATVVDTARRYAGKFDQPPNAIANTTGLSQPPHQFASAENYFPVFEGNTRDLQTLEARVVINITEFYTYMKAFRDYLRTLSQITPQSNALDLSDESRLRSWHDAVFNVVFMLFLGLESGRHAISDLVEFQPEKAERTIVILISELEAYRFLLGQFKNKQDVRYQRLDLREPNYRHLVPALISSVEGSRVEEKKEKLAESGAEWDHPPKTSKWEPAVRLLPELKTRYKACTDFWDSSQQPQEPPETRSLSDGCPVPAVSSPSVVPQATQLGGKVSDHSTLTPK
jgi:hypothetical protein